MYSYRKMYNGPDLLYENRGSFPKRTVWAEETEGVSLIIHEGQKRNDDEEDRQTGQTLTSPAAIQ